MPAAPPPSTNASLIFRLTRTPDYAATWEQFVFLYGPAMMEWCRQHRVQEADVQDISQEVLLRISRQIQRLQYNPALSFRGWLRAVVHGAWCDWVEQQQSHKHLLHGVNNLSEALNEVAARDDLVARLEAQYDRELYEIAARQVRKMVSTETWQAFEWQAVDQLCPAEVAERLGIKAASAITFRHRVTKLLRERIAQLEERQ